MQRTEHFLETKTVLPSQRGRHKKAVSHLDNEDVKAYCLKWIRTDPSNKKGVALQKFRRMVVFEVLKGELWRKEPAEEEEVEAESEKPRPEEDEEKVEKKPKGTRKRKRVPAAKKAKANQPAVDEGRRQIEIRLEEKKLQVSVEVGDGHCLFRAFARQVCVVSFSPFPLSLRFL